MSRALNLSKPALDLLDLVAGRARSRQDAPGDEVEDRQLLLMTCSQTWRRVATHAAVRVWSTMDPRTNGARTR